MEGLIEEGRQIFEPLGWPSLSELSIGSSLRVLPFEGKVLLTLRGQGQAEEGIFEVQNSIPRPCGWQGA